MRLLLAVCSPSDGFIVPGAHSEIILEVGLLSAALKAGHQASSSLLLPRPQVHSTQAPYSPKRHVKFTRESAVLGNPGTGKSTLINCLTGRALFTSGLKFGGGLTQFFQKQTHNGVVYMDTPGLADRTIQNKAAAAITAALRESGRYKIFFMVRLKGGRVMSEDLATIEAVLDTVQLRDVCFSVIVNNVQKRQYATLMQKGAEYAKVVTIINAMKYTTPHIVFIPTISELEEADNAFTALPSDTVNFIRYEAPSVVIPAQAVQTIDFSQFQKTETDLRSQIRHLETDNAALNRRMDELERIHTPILSCLRRLIGLVQSVVNAFVVLLPLILSLYAPDYGRVR